MSKTIIVHDDRIDILKDGYNIIERIRFAEIVRRDRRNGGKIKEK